MVNKNHLEQDNRQRAREVILKKHRHQGVKSSKKKSSTISSFGSFAKKASSAGLSEMLKRSDSSQKTTAPKTLEVVAEDQRDGEFRHLPSAADLVGKEKDSGQNGDVKRSDSDPGLETVTLSCSVITNYHTSLIVAQFLQIPFLFKTEQNSWYRSSCTCLISLAKFCILCSDQT